MNDPLVIALTRLIEREGGRTVVADKIGANEQSLYQIVTGVKDSKTGKPKGVGPSIRKRLDEHYPGWMSLSLSLENEPSPDNAQSAARRERPRSKLIDNLLQATPAARRLAGRIPLISWVQAGDFCEAIDNFQVGDAEDWLPAPRKMGNRAFALRVKGQSMDGPGGYADGEIIFVDPDRQAVPNCDVVVRTPDGAVTFKRLKEDVEGMYLAALNPNWPNQIIKVPEGTVFCGVVSASLRDR